MTMLMVNAVFIAAITLIPLLIVVVVVLTVRNRRFR